MSQATGVSPDNIPKTLTEDQQQILSYILDSLSDNTETNYFRSKHIADELGLSPKQVGANIGKLQGRIEFLDIEKWGRSRSITWLIELQR